MSPKYFSTKSFIKKGYKQSEDDSYLTILVSVLYSSLWHMSLCKTYICSSKLFFMHAEFWKKWAAILHCALPCLALMSRPTISVLGFPGQLVCKVCYVNIHAFSNIWPYYIYHLFLVALTWNTVVNLNFSKKNDKLCCGSIRVHLSSTYISIFIVQYIAIKKKKQGYLRIQCWMWFCPPHKSLD